MSLAERVETAAYRASIKEDLPAVTRWVLENLGQRIAAVALGLRNASMVWQYARGEARPYQDREARLRLLYRVGRTLADTFDAETARAFLISANPQLGDRSPLLVIADEDPKDAGPEVLGAVRAVLG